MTPKTKTETKTPPVSGYEKAVKQGYIGTPAPAGGGKP